MQKVTQHNGIIRIFWSLKVLGRYAAHWTTADRKKPYNTPKSENEWGRLSACHWPLSSWPGMTVHGALLEQFLGRVWPRNVIAPPRVPFCITLFSIISQELEKRSLHQNAPHIYVGHCYPGWQVKHRAYRPAHVTHWQSSPPFPCPYELSSHFSHFLTQTKKSLRLHTKNERKWKKILRIFTRKMTHKKKKKFFFLIWKKFEKKNLKFFFEKNEKKTRNSYVKNDSWRTLWACEAKRTKIRHPPDTGLKRPPAGNFFPPNHVDFDFLRYSLIQARFWMYSNVKKVNFLNFEEKSKTKRGYFFVSDFFSNLKTFVIFSRSNRLKKLPKIKEHRLRWNSMWFEG